MDLRDSGFKRFVVSSVVVVVNEKSNFTGISNFLVRF